MCIHDLLLVLLQSLNQGFVHDWNTIDVDSLTDIGCNLPVVSIVVRNRWTTRNLTIGGCQWRILRVTKLTKIRQSWDFSR